MASFETYKGIKRVTPTPTGDAGQALNENFTYLADRTHAPVGAILGWAKSFTNTPALPPEFVECNGQVLSDSDSVYNGQTIPNLNSTNRFLRGATTSGGTGGAASHSHNVNQNFSSFCSGPSSGLCLASTTDSRNHEPPYYNVVWVMRIK